MMTLTSRQRRKMRSVISNHADYVELGEVFETTEAIYEKCAALGINVAEALVSGKGDAGKNAGAVWASAEQERAKDSGGAANGAEYGAPIVGDSVGAEEVELLRLLKTLRGGGGGVDTDAVTAICKDVVSAAFKSYVPEKKVVEYRVVTDARTYETSGVQHEKFGDLLRVASVVDRNGNRPNIMVFGPKSSGKSFSARLLANVLGLEFAAHNAVTYPEELLGHVHPVSGEYHETNLVRIYRNGGVVLLDENDRSENSALLPCNGLLADGEVWLPNGELVKRHPDCIIVCTANTKGTGPDREYVGANKLDAAYLSRFAIKIQWEIDTALERAIVGDDATHKRLMKLRNSFNLKGIDFEIDTRVVQSVCDMVNQGFDYKDALGLTIVPMLEADQVTFLKEEGIL